MRNNPNDFQAAVELAGVYLQMQQTGRAVQLLDGVLSNPAAHPTPLCAPLRSSANSVTGQSLKSRLKNSPKFPRTARKRGTILPPLRPTWAKTPKPCLPLSAQWSSAHSAFSGIPRHLTSPAMPARKSASPPCAPRPNFKNSSRQNNSPAVPGYRRAQADPMPAARLLAVVIDPTAFPVDAHNHWPFSSNAGFEAFQPQRPVFEKRGTFSSSSGGRPSRTCHKAIKF